MLMLLLLAEEEGEDRSTWKVEGGLRGDEVGKCRVTRAAHPISWVVLIACYSQESAFQHGSVFEEDRYTNEGAPLDVMMI